MPCTVFYRPAMVAKVKSFSPSPGKPKLVLQDWKQHRLPIKVASFKPLTEHDISLAHDPWHVKDMLAGTKLNGFGNREPAVAHSCRYTCGAMLAAARHAIKHRVACAPVSGFHHAGYRYASGFCTFNGLMITAMNLLRNAEVHRVGILDLDQHYGDGTEDIITTMCQSHRIRHYSAGLIPQKARPFLKRLPDIVQAFGACDVLLYQAGADPHLEDPLGGWMTTAQLAERDKIVFQECARLGLPVAWNLAGGYQQLPVLLEIHRNTMKACVEAFR